MSLASPSTFPQLSASAVNSAHSGGSGTVILVLVVLVALTAIGFLIYRNHIASEKAHQFHMQQSETVHQREMQHLKRKTDLLAVMASNREFDFSKICTWIAAEGSPEQQQTLYEAFKANDLIESEEET